MKNIICSYWKKTVLNCLLLVHTRERSLGRPSLSKNTRRFSRGPRRKILSPTFYGNSIKQVFATGVNYISMIPPVNKIMILMMKQSNNSSSKWNSSNSKKSMKDLQLKIKIGKKLWKSTGNYTEIQHLKLILKILSLNHQQNLPRIKLKSKWLRRNLLLNPNNHKVQVWSILLHLQIRMTNSLNGWLETQNRTIMRQPISLWQRGSQSKSIPNCTISTEGDQTDSCWLVTTSFCKITSMTHLLSGWI